LAPGAAEAPNDHPGLEKDVSETDRYDRPLRYVWLDGILFIEQLMLDV
jgi:endonuclease YncB( thermonuclease family)